MNAASRERDLNLRLEEETPAAPPMANGELVFDEPWQGRVFGMAHALCDAGLFTWDEFREALIDEIARWERTHGTSEEYRYYDRFLVALEAVLADVGVCGTSLLEDRVTLLRARPADHDHHR